MYNSVIHIQNKKCNVSLDTSGESLHKRGYKLSSSNAPISEVLAAGILLKSNWNGESNFLDPFCQVFPFSIHYPINSNL